MRLLFVIFYRCRGWMRYTQEHMVDSLVLLLCGATVVGLYGLIFRQIIQQVPNLSSLPMSLEVLALGLIVSTTGGLAIRQDLDTRGWAWFCAYAGENKSFIKAYIGSLLFAVISILFFIFHTSSAAYKIDLGITILLLLASIIYPRRHLTLSQPHKTQEFVRSRKHALIFWQLQQGFRSLLARVLLAAQIVCVCAFFFLPQEPRLYSIGLVSLLGILTVAQLATLFARNLQNPFCEREAGISHDDFWWTLWKISIGLGAITTCILLVHVLRTWMMGASTQEVTHSFASALYPLIYAASVPTVLLQVNVRRPLLTIGMGVLCGFISSTSLLVSPALVIFIIPLLSYFGWTSQQGRFYRL
jgi:hypothetical protein